MWRVTRKGLRAHKLRFALTALAVLLGVSFMAGTTVLTDTIEKTFDDLFADVNEGTDAYVRSENAIEGDFGPTLRERIPADLVPQVEAVRGVEAAEGQVQFYAQLVEKDGSDVIGDPDMGAPTFGLNWPRVRELNPFELEDGSRPPRGPDEVVIDKNSADEGGFQVGDQVQILTQAAPKEWDIVGIAKFGDADSPGGASVSLFTTPEAQRITDAQGQFDAIPVVGAADVSQETLANRIQRALDDPEIEVLTGKEITEENQSDIEDALEFITIPLFIFAGVALLVGSFIIFNTFSIVVAQRTRELALLRALGASQRQVRVSVLLEALVVGILASFAGLAVGVLLAVGLKAALSGFGFDIPSTGLVVSSAAVMTSVIVGTVVTVLSALVPAWKGSRVAPVAAIRDVETARITRWTRRLVIGLVIFGLGTTGLLVGLFGDVENAVYLIAIGTLLVFVGVTVLGPILAGPLSRVIGSPLPRLRGMTGTLARENAMRNPRRTSATAAALMIGVAIVGFFTVFASSIKASVNSQVDRLFNSDFVISTGAFGGSGSGFSPELAAQVAALPQVGESSPLRFAEADVDGDDEFLVSIDMQTVGELFDLDRLEGDFAGLGENGIAVSKKALDDNGWELGQRIPVRFPSGERPMTIGTVYENGFREGLTDFAISLEAWAVSYPDQLDNQVYVRLADGVSAAEGRRALERVARPYPNADVQDRAEFKEEFSEQVNQILGLVYVLLFLAIFIALIGIANTLALSVFERTRELGLLRAVGMSRRQLRSSVRWESVIIAILGTLLGLVIGVFFGWAVVKALRDEGFEKFAPQAGQLILIVIAAGLAGVVAAYFPARRAAKLDVLRAVTTE
jgi:putative ABC transport system permease protein